MKAARILRVSPQALLAQDDVMFQASLREAARPEWTDLHELAAVQVELLHAIIRVLRGALGGSVPDQLHIPRPGQEARGAPRRVSILEYAKLTRGDR